MNYNFTEVDRDQVCFLPPSISDYVEADHLAHFLIDVVEQMDLDRFYGHYRIDGKGQKAFHPRMMTCLLLYAYCVGFRSSRKIEKACRESLPFRLITANQTPKHNAIARFRKNHHQALSGLFEEALRLCAEAGLVKVGHVSVDGTKIKANASLSRNRKVEQLQKEIDEMLEEAEEVDLQEAQADRGSERLPQSLANRKDRLKRLQEAKQRLEEEAQNKQQAQAEKIAEREKEESQSGQKKRGRKPKRPEEVVDKNKKANTTDPESRIMKTRTGYVQGFNGQAAATEDQVIVSADVTQEENDTQQLQPMVEQTKKHLLPILLLVGTLFCCSADAGYYNEPMLQALTKALPETELFVATKKDWKQRKALQARGSPRGRIPKGATFKEKMERKLLTQKGKAVYSKRSSTIEPVFGQIKQRGGGVCSMRGKELARSEWRLDCAVHNLLKLYKTKI